MLKLTAQPSCHERGICQRTSPMCHRVCHVARKDEPPIGYESASSNVRQLHQRGVNEAEAQDRPQDSWVTASNVMAGGVVVVGLLIVAVLVIRSYFYL